MLLGGYADGMTEGVNNRAPAKVVQRVLREEERQAHKVMRQTKCAADPNALPRRGGLFAVCELGNGTWIVPFQGSRADAKQMRGKRSSAGTTARDGGLLRLPQYSLPCVRGGGLPKARRRGC